MLRGDEWTNGSSSQVACVNFHTNSAVASVYVTSIADAAASTAAASAVVLQYL